MTEKQQMMTNMLEIDDVALNAAYWTQKKSGVQISLKNIEVPL